jgi:hypothetical protein
MRINERQLSLLGGGAAPLQAGAPPPDPRPRRIDGSGERCSRSSWSSPPAVTQGRSGTNTAAAIGRCPPIKARFCRLRVVAKGTPYFQSWRPIHSVNDTGTTVNSDVGDCIFTAPLPKPMMART